MRDHVIETLTRKAGLEAATKVADLLDQTHDELVAAVGLTPELAYQAMAFFGDLDTTRRLGQAWVSISAQLPYVGVSDLAQAFQDYSTASHSENIDRLKAALAEDLSLVMRATQAARAISTQVPAGTYYGYEVLDRNLYNPRGTNLDYSDASRADILQFEGDIPSIVDAILSTLHQRNVATPNIDRLICS